MKLLRTRIEREFFAKSKDCGLASDAKPDEGAGDTLVTIVMSNKSVLINLSAVPGQMFHVQVREYKPTKKNASRRCPTGQTPPWLPTLCDKGKTLSLPPLVDHAGAHFVDSVNQAAFSGGATRQQEAAALAWALISMIKPSVKQGKLWVQDPEDSDIKRLCSEILGVGAGLHLLTAVNAIDFRTIKKISKDFDYEAYSPSSERVLIESKGTFDGVSLAEHRKSFAKKLKNAGFLAPTAQRSYSNAIGIIFSTWSTSERGYDVELLDPIRPGETFREEHIRAAIRYYARRFQEQYLPVLCWARRRRAFRTKVE
jgi:hypothetical protein